MCKINIHFIIYTYKTNGARIHCILPTTATSPEVSLTHRHYSVVCKWRCAYKTEIWLLLL